MLLVSKNETRRQLSVIRVFRASSQVDGQAAVDSGGAGRGWKVLEASAQETQLLGPWRVGWATGPCLFWVFPWRLSVNSKPESAAPSPLSFSPSELLLLNSVALCPLPFLRAGTVLGQLNTRLLDDAGKRAGGRPPLASPREGSPATSPLLSSWGDLGLQKRGTWANAAASFHLG